MRGPIVVGVDGSPDAHAAAHYAASLAARRRTPLALIHANELPLVGYGPLMLAGSYTAADTSVREAAEKQLIELTEEVGSAHPGLEVNWRLADGSAASVLIAQSASAATTVVGSRGAGGFAGLLLGSVSTQVAAHGYGPVIVVRPAADPQGPVLVGYDGSPGAEAALSYAVQEAIDRQVALVVANVYCGQLSDARQNPHADPALAALHRCEQLLAEAVELPAEQYPQLVIKSLPIHGYDAAQALVKESARAALTVVGCRGRGGFAGLLLGSVSRTLVHHARSPVAVIHPEHA